MKQIFTLLFLIFSVLQLKADFTPISVSTMIDHADMIFYGRITKVLESDIEVSIIQNLKGEYKKKNIVIKKFQDWTCASRSIPSTAKQEAFFFIQKNIKENSWKIMGDGNEGEIPIVDKTLYFNSPLWFHNPMKEKNIIKLSNGKTIYGIAINIEEATKGISLYLQKGKEIRPKFWYLSIIDYYPKNKFLLAIINEKICENRWDFTVEEFEKRNFDSN